MIKIPRFQQFKTKLNIFLFFIVAISMVTSVVFVYKFLANADQNIIKITSKWGQMENPTIGIGEPGNTILVWQGKGGQSYEIMYQIFDNTGMPVGMPSRANKYRPFDQANPAIAMDELGNFIIVWQSYKQDGSGAGIFARSFSHDGKIITKEFRANTYLIGNQAYPDIAMNGLGTFIITWVSEGQDGFTKSIHAQMFNSMGERVGKEIKVGSGNYDIEDSPAISMDQYGNFMIVWESRENNNWNIYGQIFDSNGSRVSKSDILINSTTNYNQEHPDISTIGSNQFMVVWKNESMHDVLDSSMDNINGQIFSKTGSKSGSEFEISSASLGHQEHPSVTQTSSSKAYVSWENYSKNGDNAKTWSIYGQVVQSNGAISGDAEKISDDADRWNKSPAVASNGNGVLSAIWTSLNHKKYKKAIHYKKLVEPNS